MDEVAVPPDLRGAVLDLLVDCSDLPLIELTHEDAAVLIGMGGITVDNWTRLALGWAVNLAHPA